MQDIERSGDRRIALVNIDVQYAQVYGLAEKVRRAGLDDVVDEYDREVARILPRIRTIETHFRDAGLEVLHLRCASFTGDGRDCSRLFRSVDISATGSDRDSEILEAVAPAPGEVVLSKVSAGAFNGSELDSLLRRLRIDTLIVTGLVTGGCVEGTVRGAADRGYRVFLVEDACADWTVHQHAVSVSILGKWFATVIDPATAVAMIQGAAGADIDPPRSESSVPNRFAEAAPAGLQ